MKHSSYFKMSGSFLAVAAVLITSPALAQSTSWTGGSSYNQDGNGAAVTGDNSWHTGSNWTTGVPNAGTDVAIGLSTLQIYTTWGTCSYPGGGTYLCNYVTHTQVPRPQQHDIVQINSAAQARNLSIGFAGGRSLAAAQGAGHVVNNSTLDVGQNLVVGSTGVGRFDNNGATTVGGSLVVGDSGQGTYNNGGTLTVTGPTVLGQKSSL
jgi:hypothetical protein